MSTTPPTGVIIRPTSRRLVVPQPRPEVPAPADATQVIPSAPAKPEPSGPRHRKPDPVQVVANGSPLRELPLWVRKTARWMARVQ